MGGDAVETTPRATRPHARCSRAPACRAPCSRPAPRPHWDSTITRTQGSWPQRAEGSGEGGVLTDGEAVAIDAERGAPALFEALLLAAGVRHGWAAGVGVPHSPRSARPPRPPLSPQVGRLGCCERARSQATRGAHRGASPRGERPIAGANFQKSGRGDGGGGERGGGARRVCAGRGGGWESSPRPLPASAPGAAASAAGSGFPSGRRPPSPEAGGAGTPGDGSGWRRASGCSLRWQERSGKRTGRWKGDPRGRAAAAEFTPNKEVGSRRARPLNRPAPRYFPTARARWSSRRHRRPTPPRASVRSGQPAELPAASSQLPPWGSRQEIRCVCRWERLHRPHSPPCC